MTENEPCLDISWVMPERTPYHDFFLRRFRVECKEIRLFLDEDCKAHPWDENSGVTIEARSSQIQDTFKDVFSRSQRPQSVLIIAGWHRSRYVLLILLLALTRSRYIFWTDTPANSVRRTLLKVGLRYLITRLVFNSAEHVMSTGLPGTSNLKAMGCDLSKIQNFPFFVPISETLSKTHSRWGSVPTFISAGRLLNSVKGCEIALRAMSHALNLYRRPVCYKIAGEGPDRKKLERLVIELGMQDTVKFLGWIGSDQLKAELEAADCLIHPALYDPFPVVVLEAMAAGCVVLGSDVSGSVSDRVVSGVNGLIHPAGNIVALAEQITLICTDRQHSQAMGKLAKCTAKKWNVDVGVDMLRRISVPQAEAIL